MGRKTLSRTGGRGNRADGLPVQVVKLMPGDSSEDVVKLGRSLIPSQVGVAEFHQVSPLHLNGVAVGEA